MVRKKVLIFGASGQIGRKIIRKATLDNHKITAVTRNIHKSLFLKTQAPLGYLDIKECNIFDENKIKELIKGHDVCINLVGILFEKKNNTFKNIHTNFPYLLARICKENNLDQFIHVSALGIEKATDSYYAKSKLEGEKLVKQNFERSIILKPSIVFSQDDDFSTKFLSLLKLLPFFPIFYNTKFTPIHCTDFSEIIVEVINRNIFSETIECVGPQVLTFKEILQILLKLINKKKLLIPMPIIFSKLMIKLFELMPNPLMTLDQLRLLKYDNILSGNYKSNKDLEMKANLEFEKEVKKYSFMWKEGGEYSKN